MNVNPPTAAPMAFFVPSHNAVYDRATQQDGQWVTQREAKTLESLRRLYPDAELRESHTIDVLMGRLRKKIQAQYPQEVITTVRGQGYLFELR